MSCCILYRLWKSHHCAGEGPQYSPNQSCFQFISGMTFAVSDVVARTLLAAAWRVGALGRDTRDTRETSSTSGELRQPSVAQEGRDMTTVIPFLAPVSKTLAFLVTMTKDYSRRWGLCHRGTCLARGPTLRVPRSRAPITKLRHRALKRLLIEQPINPTIGAGAGSCVSCVLGASFCEKGSLFKVFSKNLSLSGTSAFGMLGIWFAAQRHRVAVPWSEQTREEKAQSE